MFEFSGLKIIFGRRPNKNDEVEFYSESLDEIREFVKKNLSKLSCGVLKKDGKIEYMFYRQFGNKIKWEQWGRKKKKVQQLSLF